MAIESINRQFEVFMRDMVNAQECAKDNIESDFRRLLRVTVNSCATMYGFSAEEALKRLNSSGEIIELPVVAPIQQKELEKAEKAEKVRLKELEKAEKLASKEVEKAYKAQVKEFEKAEKIRRKEFEKSKKNQLKSLEKAEKANECAERNQMKEQDIASKAIERTEKLKQKKKTVTKKVKDTDCESLASTVLMTDSEDEEIHILFQNLPLIEELNLIRNLKIQKKLSKGVKLARQILDI
jgi:hypothetical protein